MQNVSPEGSTPATQ